MALGEPHEYGFSLEDKTLPPPPPEGNLELAIRTLASDLSMLQKSGGVVPSTVEGASIRVGAGGGIEKAPQQTSSRDRSPYVIWGIIFVVGAAVLFFIGYYLVPLILSGVSKPTQDTDQTNNAAVPTSTAPSTNRPATPKPAAPKTHTSLLTSQASVASIDLYARSIPPDRTFFMQQVDAQTAAMPESSFFEIVPQGVGGQYMSWTDLAGLLGASGAQNDFLTSHFSPDYTMTVFRRSGKLYPGFIFKLNQGETPLLLQREALELESNPPAFGKLFFENPGTPVGGFSDSQISGQPIRTLRFSAPSSTAAYGWFYNEYLVVSTSETVLRLIIEHL